jgi:hypothetical protein
MTASVSVEGRQPRPQSVTTLPAVRRGCTRSLAEPGRGDGLRPTAVGLRTFVPPAGRLPRSVNEVASASRKGWSGEPSS